MSPNSFQAWNICSGWCKLWQRGLNGVKAMGKKGCAVWDVVDRCRERTTVVFRGRQRVVFVLKSCLFQFSSCWGLMGLSLPSTDAQNQLIIVLYLDLYSFGSLTKYVVDLVFCGLRFVFFSIIPLSQILIKHRRKMSKQKMWSFYSRLKKFSQFRENPDLDRGR